MVEVHAGAQREQLARERRVAPREQRREPLLGAQRGLAPDPRRAGGQLARDGPETLGDLLAGAVADARDQRVRGAHLAPERVRRGDPARVQRAVEDRQRVARRRLRAVARGRGEPRLRAGRVLQPPGGHDGRARDVDRRGAVRGRAGPAARPARRGEPADHHHLLGVVAREAAHDVAPRIGSEPPGELPLDEAEVRGRRYSPLWAGLARLPALTAYCDGCSSTFGLSIWSSRSMSLIHCSGLSAASTCFDAWRLAP